MHGRLQALLDCQLPRRADLQLGDGPPSGAHLLFQGRQRSSVWLVAEEKAACLAILAGYFPHTAEAAESRNPSAAKRTLLRAYVHQLYGYATGWL